MINNKNLTPKLRFKEFKGDWEQKRLENVFSEFKSGNNITSEFIFEEGNYPVFGGNGLRGFTSSYTHDGFYLLIGRQGALCGNINRAIGKSYITEHAIAGKGNEKSDTEWLAQRLDFFNLNRLSESSAQPGLSVSKLLRYKLYFPTLQEQQKIASFLTAVDTKIHQLTKKKKLLENYKKGVMQQLFSQQLRFKNDDGLDFPDWEKKKLKEFISNFIVPMRDKPKDLTGDIPWCRIEDFEGKFLFKSKSNQGVSFETVKKMNLKVYPVNTLLVSCSANLGFCAIVKKELITNQTFIGLVPNTQKISVDYLYHIMKLSSRRLNVLSSGTTISYLSRKQFENFKIDYPSLKEQQKIANYLSAIDTKIEKVQTQIVKTQTFKKGLLQQMFV